MCLAVLRRLSRSMCGAKMCWLVGAFCRWVQPCMHTAVTNWLAESFVLRATHPQLLFFPAWPLFVPAFVVRPSGNRCQCRYRTRRSAHVCSRGAPLHYTASCCDVGLDSTSPHSPEYFEQGTQKSGIPQLDTTCCQNERKNAK